MENDVIFIAIEIESKDLQEIYLIKRDLSTSIWFKLFPLIGSEDG